MLGRVWHCHGKQRSLCLVVTYSCSPYLSSAALELGAWVSGQTDTVFPLGADQGRKPLSHQPGGCYCWFLVAGQQHPGDSSMRCWKDARALLSRELCKEQVKMQSYVKPVPNLGRRKQPHPMAPTAAGPLSNAAQNLHLWTKEARAHLCIHMIIALQISSPS